MKYRIALTEPEEFMKKTYYGVTVYDETGELLYVEKFSDSIQAEQHVQKLMKLLAKVAP